MYMYSASIYIYIYIYIYMLKAIDSNQDFFGEHVILKLPLLWFCLLLIVLRALVHVIYLAT